MPSTGRTYRRLVSLVMFRLTVVKRKGIVKGQWWRTDRLILSAPNNMKQKDYHKPGYWKDWYWNKGGREKVQAKRYIREYEREKKKRRACTSVD